MTDSRSQQNEKPFISINTFTPVDGCIDALTEFQLTEMQEMDEQATEHGWLNNEVYRADDGSSLVVVTRFRSAAAKAEWAKTDRFKQHVEDLGPFVQDVTSVPVTFAAAHGNHDA